MFFFFFSSQRDTQTFKIVHVEDKTTYLITTMKSTLMFDTCGVGSEVCIDGIFEELNHSDNKNGTGRFYT